MMSERKLKPGSPELHDRIIRDLRTRLRNMTDEEFIAMLERRPEGMEETNMNEMLRDYDRKRNAEWLEERRLRAEEETINQNEAA